MIGGPQAGVILGKKQYLAKIKKHPLARALRVGKLTIAAIEASLRVFLEDDEYIAANHPVYHSFSRKPEELAERAETIIASVALPPNCEMVVEKMSSYVGSGSLPDYAIPSAGISVSCPDPELFLRSLRLSSPAVAARLEEGSAKFDLRAVAEAEDVQLASLLGSRLAELWA